ncbi:MAG: DUF1697 domain-containing protein [Psychrobium sp.]|nr:DUF1697 domain-containing protein [Psychrobium sp.]
MIDYICLLRGINVSGKNKIKMSELQVMLRDLSLDDVETYIQSGNVFFRSDDNNSQRLALKIQQGIKATFSLDVPTLVYPQQHMINLLNELPFANIDVASQGSQVLISLLSAAPSEQQLQHIKQWVIAPEVLTFIEATAYLHCPNGYGKTKLTNVWLEKKLAVTATTRNLKTLIKLGKMGT